MCEWMYLVRELLNVCDGYAVSVRKDATDIVHLTNKSVSCQFAVVKRGSVHCTVTKKQTLSAQKLFAYVIACDGSSLDR